MMCLILVAWRAHRDFPLVVAANRDEFYDRPASPSAFWEDAPQVLAGRDLDKGGTWLGITTDLRFAAVTNYREGFRADPTAPSRGRLVSGFLRGDETPTDYLNRLLPDAPRYNGFNLLAGDRSELCCFSNRAPGVERLAPGIYGLGNSLLDTPWPKVAAGKAALAKVLKDSASGEELGEALLRILADEAQPDDALLPYTGVSLEWERLLSRTFIRSADYGTRSSTALVVGADSQVKFYERITGQLALVRHEFAARPAGARTTA